MTRRIYKYQLQVITFQQLRVPQIGFEPLTIQMQGGQPCLWAVAHIDKDDPGCLLDIHCFGTGHELTVPRLKHLGSVQTENFFVWHYFSSWVS